jgi:hypothetical protein
MASRKIMVPVFASSSSLEIAKDSFWLARYQPAELWIVEIQTPVGFFKWLGSPFARWLSKLRGRPVEEVRLKVENQERFPCQIDQVDTPNLVLGIVEAMRWKEASTIVILPEIGESLGEAGLQELRNRLSEISSFVLIRVSKAGTVRVEPGKKKVFFEQDNIVPIDKRRWVV